MPVRASHLRRLRLFSLVEAMVAIAIISAGLAGLSQVVRASRRLEVRSRNVTTATCLARLRMEDALLELRDAQTLPAGDEGDGEGGFTGFSWSRVFEQAEHGGEPFVRVRVTVSWKERTGERSFDIATLVRAPGGGT